MKRIIFVLFVSFCLCCHAQDNKQILNAQNKQDVAALLSYYRSSAEDNKKLIKDILFSGINYDDFTYEEILSWSEKSKNTDLANFFDEILIFKEVEMIKDLGDLTPEQINVYNEHFPKRKRFVEQYLKYCIGNNIQELPFLELMYLNNVLPNIYYSELNAEKNSRGEEIHQLLANTVDDYCTAESRLINQLYYNIESKIWEYVCYRYQDVAKRYSRIGMVPDNLSSAESQYRSIVKSYLSSEQLRKSLQKDADAYCETINKARAEYARIAGLNYYTRLQITIPAINLSYNVSNRNLNRIMAARQDYKESLQTHSTVAGVASWFSGKFLAQGIRGLFDLGSVSDLADQEFSARKAYMSDVYDEIKQNVTLSISSMHNTINNYVKTNQNEFKNGIK